MNTEIVSDLAGLAKDPLSFVYWAFPWGEGLLLPIRTAPKPGRRKYWAI